MNGRQFIYHMRGLSKTYPAGKKVLDNVHLSFYPDAKIGVLGVNGSGKSTLLRIMAGLDTEYIGEGFVAEGARVGYLEQEPKLDETKAVRDNVMEGVAAKKATLDRYNELAVNYSDETADEMAKLQDEIDSKNLWDLDSQVDLAMDALRCPPDDADISKLSGGEKRRVALCKLLLDAPDLLLLDEPTNHLDMDARASLVEAINDFEGAVVLVSHDPHLVRLVADRLWLVEDGTVRTFEGDVDDYRNHVLAQRQQERRQQRAAKGGEAKPKPVKVPVERLDRDAKLALRKEARDAEAEIARLDKERKKIEAELADGSAFKAGAGRAAELARLRADLGRRIEAAEARWLKVSGTLEAAG